MPDSPRLPSAAAPLPYTVRVHARAKRVTLRVLPGQGLVVSVPTRFARRGIPAIVESHRSWAEAALADLERRTPPVCRAWPPRALELAAIGRRVAVCWPLAGERRRADGGEGERDGGRDRERGRFRRETRWRDECTLELSFRPDDRVRVASAIAEALRVEGRRQLVPWLHRLAARHGFAFERVAVRGQRSVWGSCSSRGTISLNYKLLFLEPTLVDYVLLHELAHTRHLDHSDAFWRLLETLEPRARALDRTLRAAARQVPPWLELARSRSPRGR